MRSSAVGLLTVVVLLATTGCLGLVPGDDRPTQTTTSGTTTAPSTLTPAPTPATPRGSPTAQGTGTPVDAFEFTVGELTDCGSTCRDVSATVINVRERPATNVTVAIRTFAGNETDGDPLWTNTTAVGRLAPEESVTVERQVVLSAGDALAVERADGWVAIEATIRSADESTTTVRLRNVN